MLIRHFAAQAALTLHDAGAVTLTDDVRQSLINLNTSSLLPHRSRPHEREDRTDAELPTDASAYHFGIDIGPYWYSSLGRCFWASQAFIEQEARRVIVQDWAYQGTTGWEGDARWKRKVYRSEETRHSHGSYPKSDDLGFYLAYHAMMTVAGRLLETRPLYQAPNDPRDDFSEWITEHLLSRADGRWLADRRDPVPLGWPAWKSLPSSDEWPFSVRQQDFERSLICETGEVVVAGGWTTYADNRSETVSVNSALVSLEKSAALVRALQTADHAFDVQIPDAVSDGEVNQGSFQLRGWIENPYEVRRLDQHDPWAAGIGYPPSAPAEFVRSISRLQTDADSRYWFRGSDCSLRSQVWGTYRESERDPEGERGERLYGSLDFITQVLDQTGQDLIVKVAVSRDIVRQYYERRIDEHSGYLQPYFRIYLLSSDGQWRTL